MIRVMADVGNSRLKWAKVREPHAGAPVFGWDVAALPTRDQSAWQAAWEGWGLSVPGAVWAVSSVSPPVGGALVEFIRERSDAEIRLFASGKDVPLPNELDHPETSGADRALGVLGALSLPGTEGRPGFVISCGSAVTVDRVSSRGVWNGGAIAPGLALSSETLHAKTAQLPMVHVTKAPPPLGRSTVPAIEAGVFWSCVGAIRELVTRQSEGLEGSPWIVWTGGDAKVLSDAVAFPSARWVPGLVFLGLKKAMRW